MWISLVIDWFPGIRPIKGYEDSNESIRVLEKLWGLGLKRPKGGKFTERKGAIQRDLPKKKMLKNVSHRGLKPDLIMHLIINIVACQSKSLTPDLYFGVADKKLASRSWSAQWENLHPPGIITFSFFCISH